MTATNLPDDVARFITENIESAESLEILLFLHRNPGESYTAERLSPIVYTVPAAALNSLEGLVAAGFAISDGGFNPAYRYAPTTAETARQVDGLADAYGTNRVAVIQTIFRRARSPAQEMADAFRLRGDR